MNLKGIATMAVLLCCTVTGIARGPYSPDQAKKVKAKTTVVTPEENYYDVTYVKMDIAATNTSTAITGHVTTVATVTVPSMSEYFFELTNQLTVDSAKINGQLMPVTQVSNFVNKISLAAPLTQNATFTAEVFYRGAPAGGTGFFTVGILNQTEPSIPAQVTHTVSAAFHSRDWWPCKQSLTDKIDSADIWVTVPAGLRVAGNGILKNVTPVAGGQNRYEWETRYPVDYYLLSFSVAPYVEYNYFMHFTNSTDSMLVQNYIYDHPFVLTDHKDELDSIEHIINHFSDIFGQYPFDKEKVGICQTPLGGGMENQTMVSLGSLDITLIAHELAHQWWGNNVTCAQLKDMWLNEGWATYAEQLFIERFHGTAAAKSYRTPVFNSVISGQGTSGGSVAVSDTTHEGRIYSGRLTYAKGAAVAHMLRYMINKDSAFYEMMRIYHGQHAYGTATTEDLKAIAEQVSNQDLDTFFHQWVEMEGYPTYTAKWHQNGGQVLLRLSHTTSKPISVSVFKLPIEIKLQSAQGDTVIRIYNDHAVQYYSFNWNNTMTGMEIDPDNDILDKVASITNDPGLVDVTEVDMEDIVIYPNPADSYWTVQHLPLNAHLTLTDMSGRKVWESMTTTQTVKVPAAQLARGTYVLSLRTKGKVVSYHLAR